MKKTALGLAVIMGVWAIMSALAPVGASTPVHHRDMMGLAEAVEDEVAPAAVATLILQPSGDPADMVLQDGFISDGAPDKNEGPSGSLQLRSTSPTIKSLLKWDLAAIPIGAYITSAHVKINVFYRTAPTSMDVAVYRVLTPWVEDQVTWNQPSDGSPWFVVGCAGSGLDYDSVPAVITSIRSEDVLPIRLSLEITDLVEQWLSDPSSNQGVILVASGPSVRVDMGSAESGASSNRPQLVIEYDTVPPTSTLTMTPDGSPTATSPSTLTSTPTTTLTATRESTPTYTRTIGAPPSVTPTATETAESGPTPTETPDSWLDVSKAIRANCGYTYLGDTTGKASNASHYGDLNWPETGPEDIYVLVKTVTSDLTVRLESLGGDDLDVFLLYNSSPDSLLAYADKYLSFASLAPGTYYIVVDGYGGAEGTYSLNVGCAGEPTPTLTPTHTSTATNTPVYGFMPMLAKESTPTPTATPTRTNTPIPTHTPTPTVTPTVLPFELAVNCGADDPFLASDGYTYLSDRPYDVNQPDAWGWQGGDESLVYETDRDIANTADDPIYQTHRYAMTSYRFKVPNGRYEVTLHFSEIFPYVHAGDRVFDVQLENTLVMDDFDMIAEGIKYTKGAYTFFVDVNDGRLDVMFISQSPYYAPAVNGIRVLRYN